MVRGDNTKGKTMKATIKTDALAIRNFETLPDGVRVLMTDCADYEALKALPTAIEFNNETYGRTGWNSDRKIAYFRTDAKTATIIL